jgi:hypothetical protein
MILDNNFSSHVVAFNQAQLKYKAIAYAFSNTAQALHNQAQGLERSMDAYLEERGGVEAVAQENALTWLAYSQSVTYENYDHAKRSFLFSCGKVFRWTADAIQCDPKSLGRMFGERRALDIAQEDYAQVEFEAWASELRACEGVTKANKAIVLNALLGALTEAQRRAIINANIVASNRALAKQDKPTQGRTKLLSASERNALAQGQARLNLLKQRALNSSDYAHSMRSEAQLLIDYCATQTLPTLTRDCEASEILRRTKQRAKLSDKHVASLTRRLADCNAHLSAWLERDTTTREDSAMLQAHNAKYASN